MVGPSYLIQMCIDTRSKYTEITTSVWPKFSKNGNFSNLPHMWFLNSNPSASELHINLGLCYVDLMYVMQTSFYIFCQMPNELRSTWTYFIPSRKIIIKFLCMLIIFVSVQLITTRTANSPLEYADSLDHFEVAFVAVVFLRLKIAWHICLSWNLTQR